MTWKGLASTLGIATCTFAAIGATALAKGRWGGPPGGGPGHGPGARGMHRVLSQLDLSEEQKQQLADFRKAQREDMRERHEGMRAAHEALNGLIHAEKLDEAAIRSAARALGELEAEVAIARAQSFQQLRTILTPEQLAKLESLKAEREARRDQRRDDRRERRERHEQGRGEVGERVPG